MQNIAASATDMPNLVQIFIYITPPFPAKTGSRFLASLFLPLEGRSPRDRYLIYLAQHLIARGDTAITRKNSRQRHLRDETVLRIGLAGAMAKIICELRLA